MNRTYRVFTDGSAIGNPGPGGWGAVVIGETRRCELSGGCSRTTVSEMELVAAIQALRSLPTGVRIELHSDSQYLVYGMSYFVFKWQRDGCTSLGTTRSSASGASSLFLGRSPDRW